MRIAIVGAGVAGITTAYILSRKHEVVLFEKGNYLGGHTNTFLIPDGPDEGTPVDTGFIVCNDKTYPNFHRLISRLGVKWRWSDMSFGFWDESTNLQYAGTDLNGMFAQRTNLVSPSFIRMLFEIRRFCRTAQRDIDAGLTDQMTLGEYVKHHRFSQFLVKNYLVPMGSAIWSTRPRRMLDFPAATLLRFFRNHGLLSLQDRPRWQTVVGGSSSYVQAFNTQFKGVHRLNARIATIQRSPGGVTIVHRDGQQERFDRVVLAVHADQVLPLLEMPTEDEKRLFGVWEYEANRVVLHTDPAVMPPLRNAWASWNYTREKLAQRNPALSMTYHMNRLQGLKTRRQYFVSLNRQKLIPEKRIIAEFNYTHPLYTPASLATQRQLPSLNGRDNTYYCGSYFRYGFHEDAVSSGVAVAKQFDLGL